MNCLRKIYTKGRQQMVSHSSIGLKGKTVEILLEYLESGHIVFFYSQLLKLYIPLMIKRIFHQRYILKMDTFSIKDRDVFQN